MKQLTLCLSALALSVSLVMQLSGCAAAAAAGGVVVGGTLVYQHQTIESYASDKIIAFTANNRLYGDKELYGDSHIVIAVNKGTVLLAGQAISQKYKDRAENLVKNISGVQRVYDEIVISPPTSVWQQMQDSSITSQIKTSMLAKKDFDPSAVKVITENNVVYLMGVVTPAQADQAVSIASTTSGVTKVVKVLQYINN